MPPMTISLVNEATLPLGIDLKEMAAVLNEWVQEVLIPCWGWKYNCVVVPTTAIIPNTRAIIMMDNADQQGALGYHYETPDGKVLAPCFVKDTLTAGMDICGVAAHELGELQIDPYCNLSATAVDGTQYAEEIGDPVEDQADAPKIRGRFTTNIVTFDWFNPEANGNTKYDFMGLVHKPFTLRPGGYALILKPGDANWSQVFADHHKQWSFEKEDRRGHRSELRKTRHEQSRKRMHGHYAKAAGHVVHHFGK